MGVMGCGLQDNMGMAYNNTIVAVVRLYKSKSKLSEYCFSVLISCLNSSLVMN